VLRLRTLKLPFLLYLIHKHVFINREQDAGCANALQKYLKFPIDYSDVIQKSYELKHQEEIDNLITSLHEDE
jgi:hypothetical protein